MKKLLEYIPFHLVVCLIIGIVLQFYTQVWQLHSAFFIFILFVLFIALIFFKNSVYRTVSSWILFCFLGVFITFFQNDKNNASYYKEIPCNDCTAVFKIIKKLKTGIYAHKYIAKVVQVHQQKTVGKIILYVKKNSLEAPLEVGNRLFLKPSFKTINPNLNPHQFNYKAYLEKQGVYEQVFTKNKEFKKIKNAGFSWQRMAFLIQKRIKIALQQYHFSENEFAVINALLLGQRQEISKELITDYSNAGAIHILAVSGLHIGIILLLLLTILSPLDRFKKGKMLKTIVVILFLWMFAFIAGLSASVVRAVVMFTAVAVGHSFQQKIPVEHSLILAMLLCLIFKPLFLFDVGFQLSYLAVFGIVWIQPLLYSIWQPKLNVIDYFWQLCTVSLSAQLVVLPISLLYFHQFPSLFLLSNLVIIPFLGAILMGGIGIVILAVLHLLPQFLADFYGIIISLMNGFIHFVGAQEDFLFQEIAISFTVMLCMYLFIIVIFQFFIRKTIRRLMYILSVILLLQLVFMIEEYQKNDKKEWIVFHKNSNAILGHRVGDRLFIYSSLSQKEALSSSAIIAYKLAEKVHPIYKTTPIHIFETAKASVLVIDSLNVYQIKNLKQPIVLLQYSPKINLNRLIQEIQPLQIVADGSNYKSYIHRWKTICVQQKIPFYFTGEKGGLIIQN